MNKISMCHSEISRQKSKGEVRLDRCRMTFYTSSECHEKLAASRQRVMVRRCEAGGLSI